MNDISIKEELKETLAKYRIIEQELENLEKQKQMLRSKIQLLLENLGQTSYNTVIEEKPIALQLKYQTDIKYNEELLKHRLGDKYIHILEPDLKKIKQHLHEITPALAHYMETIGSPSRDKIKELILGGEFDKQDFSGAFKKIHKTTLYVKKQPLYIKTDEKTPW
ncbi:MAG: hypothetical protein HQK76_00185 [Desulfobacterales bacterium]|nr:hypothetical protein [Desulfobacterales bacterium]